MRNTVMAVPTKTCLALLLILLLAGQSALAQQQRGGERAGDRTGQREMPMERERQTERQRERIQDPATHPRERQPLFRQDRQRLRDRDIYGNPLMTREERRQYRDRLSSLQDEREWSQFRAEHQQEMQRRAVERRFDLPPPAYGQHLMTSREQRAYQQRLARARDDRARAQLRMEHQREMRLRAREIGVDLPRPYFGQQLMTDAEREQLHERLRSASNESERRRIHAEHRQRMLERAADQQVPVAELEAD
jgi:hypothetical protein